MAARGKSVILFSKEHDATELALCFAFHPFPKRLATGTRRTNLPSLREFEEGRATAEDGKFLKGILARHTSPQELPGSYRNPAALPIGTH